MKGEDIKCSAFVGCMPRTYDLGAWNVHTISVPVSYSDGNASGSSSHPRRHVEEGNCAQRMTDREQERQPRGLRQDGRGQVAVISRFVSTRQRDRVGWVLAGFKYKMLST